MHPEEQGDNEEEKEIFIRISRTSCFNRRRSPTWLLVLRSPSRRPALLSFGRSASERRPLQRGKQNHDGINVAWERLQIWGMVCGTHGRSESLWANYAASHVGPASQAAVIVALGKPAVPTGAERRRKPTERES